MKFLIWLILLGLVFVGLERLRPWRNQSLLRKKFWQDLFYLFLNGYFVGLVLSFVPAGLVYWVDRALEGVGLSDLLSVGNLAEQSFLVQFGVVFFLIDFLQWSIHNLLHRVPFLWEFHKVHHSIETMDWMGHMRFHWMEGLFYRFLLYVPWTLLDVRPEVLFASGVFGLAMGYFNHSNLRVDIGPLGYFFNNPRMHLWHHTHPDCGPTLCNFALNLSIWDWIFGTAYLPNEKFPDKLGLAAEDRFPESLPEQLIYPFRPKRIPKIPPKESRR